MARRPELTRRRPPARTIRLVIGVAVLAIVAAACTELQMTTSPPQTGPLAEPGAAPATVAATSSTLAASGTIGAGTSAPEVPGSSVPAPTATEPSSPGAPLQGLALEVIATETKQPTLITHAPGDDRLFVLERFGRVMIVEPNIGLLRQPFLNLTDRIAAGGIEQGLLGMAFHPDYAENGRFYVYRTLQSGNRRLAEFRVTGDANLADPDTERVLFELPQPGGEIRHYGGMLMFGPDGHLYVSLGDGANASDQGQNPETLYAALLRIDVDGGDPYGIPADNPFVNGGGAPEVWAYGLRNPWRFSIDAAENLLYLADVGHAVWEEVNVVPLEPVGYNFGWPIVEAERCFATAPCEPVGITMPVLKYDHDDGCSVTGGHVYRGAAIPELTGHYFYGDWCGQWIRSFRYENGEVLDERDWTADLGEVGQPNAFGVDSSGELYVATFDGTIAKIVPER